MVSNLFKKILAPADYRQDVPVAPAKTFTAGGSVGDLHRRLRDEMGLDWDDGIVSGSAESQNPKTIG